MPSEHHSRTFLRAPATLPSNGTRTTDALHQWARYNGRRARLPKKHFTVTAFVSTDDHTLLHWHRGNRMWLPPGGHIEPDEDPIDAVQREVEEETGLRVTVLPTATPFDYDAPPQLPPPVTIMIEDIADHPVDGAHQHIDLIYFTRPSELRADAQRPAPSRASQVGAATPQRTLRATPKEGWHWVSADDLRADEPIPPTPDATPVHIPQDVRVLGLASIDRVAIARAARD